MQSAYTQSPMLGMNVIVIVGCGYVGLSLATLLSQKYSVVAIDIILEKVEMIRPITLDIEKHPSDHLFLSYTVW